LLDFGIWFPVWIQWQSLSPIFGRGAFWSANRSELARKRRKNAIMKIAS
jgi:hypothetical protein